MLYVSELRNAFNTIAPHNLWTKRQYFVHSQSVFLITLLCQLRIDPEVDVGLSNLTVIPTFTQNLALALTLTSYICKVQN